MTVASHTLPLAIATTVAVGAVVLAASLNRPSMPGLERAHATSESPRNDKTPAPAGTRPDLSEPDRRRVAAVTRPTLDFAKAEPFEAMSGGAGTVPGPLGRDSLSRPASNLDAGKAQDFPLGDALFEKLWVSSPSSTQASDGLGPLYNARACATCHVRDGRAHVGEGEGGGPGLVLRLARREGAFVLPDPVYGRQLQTIAVPGLAAEGRLRIRYEERPVTLSGGETVRLRHPSYSVGDLAYGPLDAATGFSPRLAPPMTGLGLIEAIHPDDILASADPDDRDGDGISGRAAFRPDPVTGAPVLGRFGWKAEVASVRRQAAEAFATDIGISTPDLKVSHGDCTPAQAACMAMEDGVQARLGDTEAPDPVLDLVASYARHLAVPARRSTGAADVLAGKKAFYEAGCATCHVPKFVTRRDASDPSLAFQLIWPYSDMLLHDMGEGLSDLPATGSPSGPPILAKTEQATAPATTREWRTPPLWGIGLAGTVDARTTFLHDGRARTLAEAILWHGGEGQAARDRFADLAVRDRRALIVFLESL